jgi:catechol 2,3-dioxygenase-like lactoylglutathione lyase family enzyme
MKIKLTKVYVDDQDKALAFYTEKLGFVKKAEVVNGPYRWLTVASTEDPDGIELQLALNDDPAGKAYQQAVKAQSQPAALFHTSDLQGEYDRLAALGVSFTVPLTNEAWGSMATVDDTCGNLIQLTQPAW